MNVRIEYCAASYRKSTTHTFAKYLKINQIHYSFFNNFSSKSTILYIMKTCIKFVSLMLAAIILYVAPSHSQIKDYRQLFEPSSKNLPPQLLKDLEKGIRLSVNQSVRTEIYQNEPEEISLTLPLGNQTLPLVFQKVRTTSTDFKVKTSDGKVLTGKEVTGVQYQIKPKPGLPIKVGGLGFSKNDIYGVISDEYGNWNLGILPQGEGDYVLFCERDLKVQSGFQCETPDEDIEKGPEKSFGNKPGNSQGVQASGTCRLIRVYFECDFRMYTDNGSSIATTTTRVNNMFNLVKQLYKNEQIDIELSEVFVWTSTDPYASYSSSNTYLINFANNRTTFNGNLAHFLTTRPASLGGLAYTNVLCNTPARYAFSNIFNTFSALPTYSWSINCIAHELGHNFGSKHTHWCGWQLTSTTIGRIDSCYAPEVVTGAVNCGSNTKSNPNGTIMSYCHINGAINFNRGFGPLPGNRMRESFAAATCISGAPVPTLSASGTRVVCAGGTISLNASTSVTGGTFSWTGPNGFTSSAQNPTITNAPAAANGSYNCTLSKSGCTSDPVTVPVVVNDQSSPPVVEGFEGSFPAGNWRISNPNNDRTFVQNTTVGGFGTSTRCISFDNYNLPFIGGRVDTLFAPVVDLTGLTGATFRFDVAYAYNGVSDDSLIVMASTNCGRTFVRLYAKARNGLATAPNNINPFTPTSSQWRTETINLSAYNGLSQVQIAFLNKSGGGNFLYIDNVNLSTTGGTGSPSISINNLSQSTWCPGANISLSFSTTGSFNSGNTFTAQLSNASGSFASPTTIGSGTSSPISATIPVGTTTGTGYQIRIVASNPNVTSSTTSSFSVQPLSVSAGSAQNICANDAAINLNGSPSGGTWSGNGVSSSGVFTPTSALVGNQTLTYTVNSGGCSGSGTVVVTVRAIPAISAGSSVNTCSNAAPFNLTGNSPTGGVWSGNGVSSAGLFTPSPSLVGTHTLTYTVTSNGCSNSANRTVTVQNAITVSAGSNQTVCSNGAALTLTGSPSGGTWSGTGVSATGVFTPSSALIGNRTLTYTVGGTCGGSSNVQITVNAAPTVNAGIDQQFCSTDDPYLISQGSPTGGTWSGNGVSGTTFSPSTVSTGSHTLTYTVTQNGCTSSSTVDFTVNATPNPTLSPAQEVCAGSGNLTLSAVPSGGVWSGPGVSPTGIFQPNSSLIGTQTLSYQVVQNGCAGTASTTVTVLALPVADAGIDQSATSASGNIQLNGSPAGGTWTGTGVSSSGLFSPSVAGLGSFTLTYTVTQNGCSHSDQLIFTVVPATAVNAGSNQSICESAAPITLTGTPSGGTWSGPGVTESGIFTPNSSLMGSNVLTYTVAGHGSSNVTITVISAPVVNAGSNQTVCSTGSNFNLTGATPPGGTWSGTGISSAGLVNRAALSSSGSIFTYSVTQNGCTASTQVVITAVPPPTVNAGSNQNICKNAPALQLNGSPAGGTWSGNGVSPGGLFDPSSVAAGNQTLTYTVQGSIAGCAGSSQVVFQIFNIPTVSAGIDRSTCANSAPFSLTGTPTGGVWSGPGVSGSGLFSPSVSLIGIQTATYTVTQNGCSNASTVNISVNALPQVSAGSNLSICTNSGAQNLNGASPSGGTWSGAPFVSSSGQLNPPYSAGTYTLTYSVTQNGCTGTDQLSLTVRSTPTVNAGSNRSICANGSNLTLTGFSPSGGVWSGNGVSPTGVFSPSSSLVGNQVLTYSVTQNGCTGSSQITVNVKSIPSINTGPNESACQSGLTFKLSGYSPRGGKWTGPGVVQDSLYQPSASLVGTHTLTYSVTSNGCTNSAQKSITVTPGNTIVQGEYPPQLCTNSIPVTFTGFAPQGGIWKGPGMAPNGTLTPNSGITGSRVYTYRLDLNGCRDSIQVSVNINPIPAVSAGPNISVCASGAPVPLTNATPAGGIWTGPGVNDSGLFNPNLVSAGVHALTYSFTENGCTGSSQMTVNVSASPNVSAGVDRNICRNSVPVTLIGSPFGGTWSGPGVTSGGIFTPSSSMSGNITLTYSINQNGCTGTDQMIVSITNPVSVNAGSNQTVCNNANAFNLSGFSPSGGTWSGQGVSSSGQFNPAGLAAGNVVLTYRVTQSNCTVESNKTITVNAAPIVNAGSDQTICSNTDALTLSGFSPAGGTWSGSGVNASGVFSPSASLVGNQVLTYTVTQNNCSSSQAKVVTVVAAPNVFAGPGLTVCGLSNSIAMSGFFPSGGTWSGQNIDAQGQFTPSSSQLGTTVAATYTVTQNGCTATDVTQILVVNIPSALSVTAPSNTACQGQVLPLNLDLQNTSSFAIQWMRDGAAILGATGTQYLAGQSGNYQVEVKASSCVVSSNQHALTFNTIPNQPSISQNGLVLTSSSATGNQWMRNGQNIPGATGQQFSVVQSGIYTVVVSEGGCLSEVSAALAVNLTSVDDEQFGTFNIRMFPNPASHQVTLACSGSKSSKIVVSFINSVGRQVAEDQIFDLDDREYTETTIPLRGLSPGAYWMKVANGDQVKIQKLIIR